MEINHSIISTLIYHSLNLDYPRGRTSYDNQTNVTISTIMNDFIHKYKNDFKNKTFILIYNDDIYSLIAYQIIKNIQGLFSFNLKVDGKRKNTKTEISKKDFLNYFQKKKLNKDNIIYISCFNPIYKVKNNENSFKELSHNNEVYNIIEKFTPLQFQIMSEFYSIKNNKLLQEFYKSYFVKLKWFTLHPEKFQNKIDFFIDEYSSEIIDESLQNKIIYLIKLNGDENDFPLFDKLLNTNGIFLYFYDSEKINFLEVNFNFYIEPRNKIDKNNSNNFILAQKFLRSGINIEYFGNWTEEEKETWRRLK